MAERRINKGVIRGAVKEISIRTGVFGMILKDKRIPEAQTLETMIEAAEVTGAIRFAAALLNGDGADVDMLAFSTLNGARGHNKGRGRFYTELLRQHSQPGDVTGGEAFNL